MGRPKREHRTDTVPSSTNNAYYVPGPMLGAGVKKKTNKQTLAPIGLTLSSEKTNTHIINT